MNHAGTQIEPSLEIFPSSSELLKRNWDYLPLNLRRSLRIEAISRSKRAKSYPHQIHEFRAIRAIHRANLSLERKFREIALVLRRGEDSLVVKHGIDSVRGPLRPLLELYLEGSKADGNSICWWIELGEQEGTLSIDASLRRRMEFEDTLWEETYRSETLDPILEKMDDLLERILGEVREAGPKSVWKGL